MIEFWAVVSRPVLLGCIKETYLHCDGVSCIYQLYNSFLAFGFLFFFFFLTVSIWDYLVSYRSCKMM